MKVKIAIFCVTLSVAAMFPPVYAQVSVMRVTGEAAVWDTASGRWRTVSGNEKIQPGSHVRTARRSTLEGATPQNHKIKIEENSRVVIDEAGDTSSMISVTLGKIRSWVKKLRPSDKYQIKTPISVISVRGTDFAVGVDENSNVRVEVYEGVVAAREESTGSEVEVKQGQSTTIEPSKAPAPPENMEPERQSSSVDDKDETRRSARAEMFDEISKDAVLDRAAQEMKLAEYQNGKALVDASGLRVRLEEYIVRPADNQFKYVVLNTRENRFDFGKILFTFNGALPSDLTLATRTMFEAAGAVKPSLYLTGVDSVMSNTVDKVNEIASNCDMVADDPVSPSRWSLFPGSYEFYVNGAKRWSFADGNNDKKLSANELSYFDAAGAKIAAPASEYKMPSGPAAFHFYQKNTYSDGFWIAADDHIIDDDGKTLTLADLKNKTSAELNAYAYKLNFERAYTSSAFTNAAAKNAAGEITIDLVFSSKLLIDSGMLSLPNPQNYQALSN